MKKVDFINGRMPLFIATGVSEKSEKFSLQSDFILVYYTDFKITMLIIDDKEDVNGEFLSQFESNEVPVFTHAEVLIGSQVYQVILRGKAALYLSL